MGSRGGDRGSGPSLLSLVIVEDPPGCSTVPYGGAFTAQSVLEACCILVEGQMCPQSHLLIQPMRRFTSSSCASSIKPPAAQRTAASPSYQTNLARISHTQLADVAQGVPSGPVPAVSRLVSTPVRGRDTVSNANVGMSACATSSHPNTGEKSGLAPIPNTCTDQRPFPLAVRSESLRD